MNERLVVLMSMIVATEWVTKLTDGNRTVLPADELAVVHAGEMIYAAILSMKLTIIDTAIIAKRQCGSINSSIAGNTQILS